jgi:hypothetical protein
MHALDASVDSMAGQVDLHFEAADPTRNVTATFAGIRGKSAPQPDDAQYKLVTAADHSSGFAYSTHVDFDGDGTQDQIAHIDSQWSPTGAGVAHLMSSTAALELAWSTRSSAGTRRRPALLHRRRLYALCCWRRRLLPAVAATQSRSISGARQSR